MTRIRHPTTTGKPEWAVAVHRRDVPLELELSQAISRCLQQLGHSVRIVCDGEPEGLQASSLLLLLNLANFPGYTRQLRQAGPDRPRVLVWQMDPLPPTRLPPEAEELGLKAAAWRRRLGLASAPAALPHWRKLATGRRLRGRIYRFCSGFAYRQASQLIRQTGAAQEDLDWTQVRGTLEAWLELRQGLAEGWVDHLAVSTRQRQHFLATRGIAAPFIPVGGCDELGRDLGLERDRQVLFLGRVRHGPRAAKLARIERELRAAGISLNRITDACYGAARDQALNRTALVLNLHQYPWSPAWIRFVMAAVCGALVVSEPAEDQEPFTAEVHYAAAPADRLAGTIIELLNDPPRRIRLSAAAAALCRGPLTMLDSVRRLCSLSANQPA